MAVESRTDRRIQANNRLVTKYTSFNPTNRHHPSSARLSAPSTYALVRSVGETITAVAEDIAFIGPGHVRILRLSSSSGKSTAVGEYSPRMLNDLKEPLYLSDDSGLFGVAALGGNPANTSYNGTPLPAKPTQVAVVRIR